MRRQKEPADVYGERLSRVFYENYIGSIIDWYAATLFRREPILSFRRRERGGARRSSASFTEDCDLKETSLSEFFRRQLVEALVGGSSYILVDFPEIVAAGGEPGGGRRTGSVARLPGRVRAGRPHQLEPRRSGQLRVGGAEDVGPAAGRGRTAGWTTETRWSYYDKEEFRIYRGRRNRRDRSEAGTVDAGRHGLAGLRRVPLFPAEGQEGLWLMNKAALLQLEHFNKSNALGWALTMGLFAMPVVYSDREWNQIVGESYYIQLGPNDKFGWTEPEGKVYQIAADNLDRLKNEIYRVCYMIPQAWD